MSKDIAGSEQLKEQLFAILDKYYTLEHPDELGIEPEHKLLQLIAAHDAEKKQQAIQAFGERLLLKAEQRQILVGQTKTIPPKPVIDDWQAVPITAIQKELQ